MYYYCTTIFNFLVSKGFKNGIRVYLFFFSINGLFQKRRIMNTSPKNTVVIKKNDAKTNKWKQVKISFALKKIDINRFSIKKIHLLFHKKFSPLCKNKQDFFVNSHSLIRGRTFFGAILICIKNKYDYKIMWKKMLPTIKTLLFSWNQFHEIFKFCHVFKVACNVYVCASARFFFVFITNILKK